jgi:hypothetical protein
VLPKSAIDDVVAADPSCLAVLLGPMKQTLNLKPSIGWLDVQRRLDEQFGDKTVVFDFLCGAENEEVITWEMYQSLLSQVGVKDIDQKLLWVELDTNRAGDIDLEHFADVVYGCSEDTATQEFLCENDEDSPSGSGREASGIAEEQHPLRDDFCARQATCPNELVAEANSSEKETRVGWAQDSLATPLAPPPRRKEGSMSSQDSKVSDALQHITRGDTTAIATGTGGQAVKWRPSRRMSLLDTRQSLLDTRRRSLLETGPGSSAPLSHLSTISLAEVSRRRTICHGRPRISLVPSRQSSPTPELKPRRNSSHWLPTDDHAAVPDPRMAARLDQLNTRLDGMAGQISSIWCMLRAGQNAQACESTLG